MNGDQQTGTSPLLENPDDDGRSKGAPEAARRQQTTGRDVPADGPGEHAAQFPDRIPLSLRTLPVVGSGRG